MSDKTKTFMRAEAAPWDAEQVIDNLRNAAVSGDRTRVVTAINLLNVLKKIFGLGAPKFDDFMRSTARPGVAPLNPRTLHEYQQLSQAELLDWIKDHGQSLSPGLRKQFMQYIESSTGAGGLEVDAAASFKNMLEGGHASPMLPKTFRSIMDLLLGNAEIANYLKSNDAVLHGVYNAYNRKPVTLYDYLNNRHMSVVLDPPGTNFGSSLSNALDGLKPLLKNKAQVQQVTDFAKKAITGVTVVGVAAPIGIGLATMQGPSTKRPSKISGDIYPEKPEKDESKRPDSGPSGARSSDEASGAETGSGSNSLMDGRFTSNGDQKPASAPHGGLTNGNIGSLGGQFTSPEFRRVLEKSYINQQDKMLPNPGTDSNSDAAGMTRRNSTSGALRVAADENSLLQMAAASDVPDLAEVLGYMQKMIDQNDIKQANDYVMALSRAYGPLANQISALFERQRAE